MTFELTEAQLTPTIQGASWAVPYYRDYAAGKPVAYGTFEGLQRAIQWFPNLPASFVDYLANPPWAGQAVPQGMAVEYAAISPDRGIIAPTAVLPGGVPLFKQSDLQPPSSGGVSPALGIALAAGAAFALSRMVR